MKKLFIILSISGGLALLAGVMLVLRPDLVTNPLVQERVHLLRSKLGLLNQGVKGAEKTEETSKNVDAEVTDVDDGHSEFTEQEVQQVMRQLLEEKRREQALGSENAKSALQGEALPALPKQQQGPKYIYRIDLHNGVQIFTKTVHREDGKVRYEERGGLVITLDADRVKDVHKFKVAQTPDKVPQVQE